jgi:cobalt/nickel transport system permease protein
MKHRHFVKAVCPFSVFLLLWQNHACALAMHLAEGILPVKWSAIWFALSLPVIALSVLLITKSLMADKSRTPLYGLVGALIFIVSLLPIPVPISGTCSHPCGTPLGAMLAGAPAGMLMGAIALLFQALFFAHGGLSTWGANIFSMAITGSLIGYVVYRISRRAGLGSFPSAFLAGFLGDLAVYLVTALQLSLSLGMEAGALKGWGTIFVAFLPTQLPLAVLEGVFTGGIVTYMFNRKPSLLGGEKPVFIWNSAKIREGGLYE